MNYQLRGISNEAAYITIETARNIKLGMTAREAVYCDAAKVEVTLSRPYIARIFIGPEVFSYCEGILWISRMFEPVTWGFAWKSF